MIVFGDATRLVWPREELPRLIAALQAIADLPAGLPRHERLVALFIDASELAQGLADAETQRTGYDDETPLTVAATALVSALAVGLVRSWASGFMEQPAISAATAEALLRLDLPGTVAVKRAEGYAFYAVYPESYAEAAHALGGADLGAVVGIRSIGLGLACVVSAASGGPPPLSVRPVGHPFNRHLAVSSRLGELLVGAAGQRIAVVDEGPGLSGSSFGAVAGFLEAHGFSREHIDVFPSHSGDPGPQASESIRTRWPTLRKHVVKFDELLMRPSRPEHALSGWIAERLGSTVTELTDISGGRWRAAHTLSETEWPPADVQMESRKFLVRSDGGPWLAKFSGLGRYGVAKQKRAEALAAAGFSPEVRGLCHGFLLQRWEAGRPLVTLDPPERGALRLRLADYLAFRAQHFAVPKGQGASLARLAEMAIHNVGEWLGQDAAGGLAWLEAEADGLQRCVNPVATDNRLHAWEWLHTSDSRILKTDAVDHCESHDLIGCQDIAWDIAGAAVEFGLSADEVGDLCARIAAASGRKPNPRLVAFLLPCYLAFQIGAYAMAAGRLPHVPAEAARLSQRSEHYAAFVPRVLGCDGRAVARWPLPPT